MRLRRRGEAPENGATSEARGAGSAPVRGDEAPPEGRHAARPGAPGQETEGSRRGGVLWRTRDAGAAAVGTAGAGVLWLARLVMMLATLIALLVGLAIVLRDLDANPANSIVKGIHEGANFFAGAFTGLLRFHGHPKRAITVDWGIALIVYLLVGALISRVIASVGRGGLLFERRHRSPAATY